MNPNVISILLVSSCLFSVHAVGNEMEASYEDASAYKTGTSFRLFTRQNMEDDMFQFITLEDVTTTSNFRFDHSKETKIVVHGFISNGLEPWMLTMKNELLKAGDFNVILVDWEKGAKFPYTVATANTRVVGADIAILITVLEEQFLANLEDFHIIGHSLGAHVGGYAGERLPNLGRITGLDPAELNFQYKDINVRLDPTDAKFVDVIHTDGKRMRKLGFGMIQAVGHVDFYPNGGLSQPGCSPVYVQGIMNNESINSACPFMGYRCQSYADFKRGVCMTCFDGGCGYMGFHATQAVEATNVAYFLYTGNSSPFCRYHYHIKVSLGNESDSKRGRGQLMLTLMGSNGQLGPKYLTYRNIYIEPGETYMFVMTSVRDIGTVSSATVVWHHRFHLVYSIVGRNPAGRIYIDKLEIVNADSIGRVTLCGEKTVSISGVPQYFTTKC